MPHVMDSEIEKSLEQIRRVGIENASEYHKNLASHDRLAEKITEPLEANRDILREIYVVLNKRLPNGKGMIPPKGVTTKQAGAIGASGVGAGGALVFAIEQVLRRFVF